MSHISCAFIRGFAEKLRPIAEFEAQQLVVIADHCCSLEEDLREVTWQALHEAARMVPYEERARMDLFLKEWGDT
jgi:hypothetical protein